jgi:heme-degrading monooxygenase HmoA
MHARVTSFDIDTVAISMPRAIQRFADQVLPSLREQPGYRGVCVLDNDEGRGLLVSFWESEEAASSSVMSGFYDEQASKFLTVYRQPPGREHYEVGLLDLPAATPA